MNRFVLAFLCIAFGVTAKDKLSLILLPPFFLILALARAFEIEFLQWFAVGWSLGAAIRFLVWWEEEEDEV